MSKRQTPEEKTKILVVDDDRKLCRLISDYLEPMGYAVSAAYNGSEGLEMILSDRFDLVILDVMMPEMDGFEVLRRARKSSDIPILMFTARGEEIDRIVGLELGADDYLPKTFSSRELLARIRAVIRRYSNASSVISDDSDETLIFDELRINRDSRSVNLGDELLGLTPVEFDLLFRLASSPGRVLNRDQLMETVTERSYEIFDRAIDVHISSLRRKLNDDPRNPRFIHTVRTAGYMFKPGKENKP